MAEVKKFDRTGFIAVSTIFLTRGFLFSTWLSRGPEVKDFLGLNNAQMGLFTMLSAIGGLLGIIYSGRVTTRFGSKNVSIAAFITLGISFLGLGISVQGDLLYFASLALLIMGIPIAAIDFAGNLEATVIDQTAQRSLMPAIHSAYSLGMLSGAGTSSLLITADVSLAGHFATVAIAVGLISVFASSLFPTHEHIAKAETAEEIAEHKRMRTAVWREHRSRMITLIGFAFILSEFAAGTWVPIALSDNGYSDSVAAFAISLYWIAILIGRLSGGVVVDKWGRVTAVNISLTIEIIGLVIFAATPILHMPFLGLFLWGLGMSNGFPMMITAMGDDLKWANPRVSMIITTVYISSLSVGPVLGFIGQITGLYAAFTLPILLLVAARFISKESAPLK